MKWEAVCEVLIRGEQKLNHARVSYEELKLWVMIDLQILVLDSIWHTLLFLLSIYCLNLSFLCTKGTINLLCPYPSESYRFGMNSVLRFYLYSVKREQATDSHLQKEALTQSGWIGFSASLVCMTNSVMTLNVQTVKISWKKSDARFPLWLHPLLNTWDTKPCSFCR